MIDVEDVDFDVLMSDLKTADANEYIESAKLMITADNDQATRSIVAGALHAIVIKKSNCLDTVKVIDVIDSMDPSIIKNLRFKIARKLNI